MKIIQIATLPFGRQSSIYQTFGFIYALSDDGRIFCKRSEELNEAWQEDVGTFPAPQEIIESKLEQRTTNKGCNAASVRTEDGLEGIGT